MMPKEKDRTYVALGALSVVVFIIVGVVFFRTPSDVSESFTDTPESTSDIPPPQENDRYKWKTDSDITLINYFSLDCPHCRELFIEESERQPFYENTFNLIYRHSPLPNIQPLSGGKAVMAECVRMQSGDQGFYDFIESVYSMYRENHSDNEWVEALALDFVPDEKIFTKCLLSEGPRIVERAHKETLSHRVYGTPTIAIFRDGTEVLRLDKTNVETVLRIMDSLRRTESR